jgi:hypothetical protein
MRNTIEAVNRVDWDEPMTDTMTPDQLYLLQCKEERGIWEGEREARVSNARCCPDEVDERYMRLLYTEDVAILEHRTCDPIYKGIQYKGGWYGGYTFTIDGEMSRSYETEAAVKGAITRYLNVV